ncbi:MAG: amino acid adenylation domain-containing protein, partial [Chitinophagaceae bacterium]
GKPKGVMITHKSLLNYSWWAAGYYLEGKPGCFALYSSISFDLTVTSIFTPLITGNKIEVYKEEEKSALLSRVFNDDKADVIKLTPSHLRLLLSMEGVKIKGKGVKKLIVGGEQLETQLARAIYERSQGSVEIYNEYGPTETTVGCMIYRFDEQERHPVVPIGVPVSNTQVYLLNKELDPVVCGVEGELYVSGEGVGEGYWNDEEQTTARFMENPFVKGTRMYRTGDTAVWLADGRMLFRGRADEQVKIRGYRIEPGEIEQQLLSHDQVQQAVVVPGEGQGDKYLVAYYVSGEEPDSAILRSYLQSRLPEYMVPACFVRIDHLPLTVNGKLDRKALPDPQLNSREEYVAPSGEIEEKLVQVWAEVLKTDPENISVEKNFFELGGHSLRAIELVNKIHKEMGVEISLDDIFEHNDIISLSKLILAADKNEFIPILKTEPNTYYASSSTQKGMFFLNELDKQSLAYNMPRVIKLEGALNKDKINKVFNQLVARHEIFRTSFEIVNEVPVQKVADQVDFKIEEFQFKQEEIELMKKKFIRPFDLKKPPLLRAGLIKVNANEHFLVVDVHHIIMDGTSNGILIKEFVDLYNDRKLPEQKLQYKDYTEWLQSPARQQEISKQREFWLKEFSGGMPVMELPADFSRPLIKSHEGSTIDFNLSVAETLKIKSIEESEGCTFFMVLISMYYILLAKITGQEDVVVGASVSSRKHEDLKEMLGLFLDTIPIRNYPKKNTSFRNFLKAVKTKTLSCFDNQSYQYEELADELNVKRDVTHNALFDVMFAVQNFEKSEFKLPDLSFTTYSRKGFESKFDLTLTATEQADQIYLSLEYCTKLFKKETVERFISYLKNIVAIVLSDINIKIGDIEIISEEEKHQILGEFNTEPVLYAAGRTVIDLFEENVQQAADSKAILFRDESLTYDQLNRGVNRLSNYLSTIKKMERQDVVGIYFDRSAEMIISLLAVLKSGAIYVSIEPHYPKDRIASILKEANIKSVLTNISDNDLKDLNVDIIDINKESGIINRCPDTNPAVPIGSGDTAYIIYTSGSTGSPKGIQVGHSSLLDYTLTFKDFFAVTAKDKVIQQSSLSFDTYIEEIFPALLSGALILVMPDSGMDIQWIVQSIKQENATILSTTPLVLNELNAHADDIDSLRIIISGGDVLKPAHIDKLISKCPLYNTYGPAESTVCITYNKIDTADNAAIIGRPIRNRELLILNMLGGLCPVGIKGEICVAGAGLAKGYINNEAATKEKFLTHPYSPGERMYRTGDFGRWLPDGKVEFLGRMDDQVKIRGFRIELGEIETVLNELDGIREAVVLAYDIDSNNKSLAAFIVLSDPLITIIKIRKYLREKLANYMIPALIVRVDKIPYNSNGKTDREALLSDIPANSVLNANKKLPETNVEQQVAGIWKDLLNVESVGMDDTFFDLGGHSLLLIKNNERIKKIFNVELPLNLFFYQTLEQIALEIDKKLSLQSN